MRSWTLKYLIYERSGAHERFLLVPLEMISSNESHNPDSFIGVVLADRYEVVSFIGRGGTSLVYKARHQQQDREVAVKLLQADLVSDQLRVKRFHQEVQTCCLLSHPHVVTVFDFGIAGTGQPFLVMEMLEGCSLLDAIKVGRGLSLDRVLDIFSQTADALDHAHRKGVVHRDLKPSNIILIQEKGKHDYVKVVDFGIAKIMPGALALPQRLTKTGEVFGSPSYMSPEQCMGEKLDNRSDVYSLGVMMYECITGKPPFAGESVMETMVMHTNEKPSKFRTLLGVPTVLERVVFKALEKDPSKRYQSMADLRLKLEEIVQERSLGSKKPDTPSTPLISRVSGNHPGVVEKVSGRRDRTHLWLAMALVAAAATVVFFGGSGIIGRFRHLFHAYSGSPVLQP